MRASLSLSFSDQPILSFRRNAFLPLKEEKRLIAKRNSKEALTLLYHEVNIVYVMKCIEKRSILNKDMFNNSY